MAAPPHAIAPALDAYERTAPHYDAFTAHHDYDLWLGNLLPELRRRGLRAGRLLDIGCGTGKSFLPMLDRGWEVTAVDLSPAMLARARAKAAGRARLEVADMRNLPCLGAYELVWALDDAINYLLSVDELAQALAGFERNLAEHGLCLFDVNTLASYRSFFAETHVVEAGARRLVWSGRADAGTCPGAEVVASLAVEGPDGALDEPALHRQRHFRPEEVERALAAAGLECLAVFGHGLDAELEQPLDESRHTKAIYIARKPERR